ncbi:MAG TPA: hypothetical protein VGX46_09965 [Vicinamibacterales bacterium]|jgi:DNA-binding beta-propeller fold protein YncE|nr:hypothetical protein [Vicinamibacterales bacterium]
MKPKMWGGASLLALTVVAIGAFVLTMHGKDVAVPAKEPGTKVPTFEIDPTWPKPHENWLIGHATAIAADRHGHMWVIQRPASLTDDELGEKWGVECCVAAPPVIEFDEAGNVVQAWGGSASAKDWPAETAISKGVGTPEAGEHGIFVDYKDNVWIAGSGSHDGQVLKFTKTGKLLLEIGRKRRDGEKSDSNDSTVLSRAANMCVWPQTNEVFISDGYGNRRVIVFDADTGAYKRHWGAYGKRPDDAAPKERSTPDGPLPQQFNTVHSVRIANDGLVYVADRVNDRMQVFKIDGTFVKEQFIARGTRGQGTVSDFGFSPDAAQKFLYSADGSNQHVWILERQTLQVVGKFGRRGRNAGQLNWMHALTTDSKGNIYTGEGNNSKRFQRFLFKGLS